MRKFPPTVMLAMPRRLETMRRPISPSISSGYHARAAGRDRAARRAVRAQPAAPQVPRAPERDTTPTHCGSCPTHAVQGLGLCLFASVGIQAAA